MDVSIPRLGTACYLAGLLGLLVLPASPAFADEKALAAIERMNRSLRDLSYEGEFVFRQGDRMQALRITHRVRGGQEYEHLLALNGDKREVVRDRNQATCLVPGRGSQALGKRLSGRGASPLLPLETRQLSRYYRFKLGDAARTAGRQSQIVEIQSRDQLRYGYRIYLDTETYLPLRSQMLDETGNTLSEILFTSLRILPMDHLAGTVSVTAPEVQLESPIEPLAIMRPPAWQFTTVPEGFMMNAHRRRGRTEVHGEMEHFVFSDGLATVSVYIEPMAQGGFEGVSTIGTLNALGRRLAGHQVTVVGEVPEMTLRQLAAAVVPATREQ